MPMNDAELRPIIFRRLVKQDKLQIKQFESLELYEKFIESYRTGKTKYSDDVINIYKYKSLYHITDVEERKFVIDVENTITDWQFIPQVEVENVLCECVTKSEVIKNW